MSLFICVKLAVLNSKELFNHQKSGLIANSHQDLDGYLKTKRIVRSFSLRCNKRGSFRSLFLLQRKNYDTALTEHFTSMSFSLSKQTLNGVEEHDSKYSTCW